MDQINVQCFKSNWPQCEGDVVSRRSSRQYFNDLNLVSGRKNGDDDLNLRGVPEVELIALVIDWMGAEGGEEEMLKGKSKYVPM